MAALRAGGKQACSGMLSSVPVLVLLLQLLVGRRIHFNARHRAQRRQRQPLLHAYKGEGRRMARGDERRRRGSVAGRGCPCCTDTAACPCCTDTAARTQQHFMKPLRSALTCAYTRLWMILRLVGVGRVHS